MRTIHADLLSAQQSGKTDPYIYLNINSTNYSSRLVSLEHIEEPYMDRATIVLANSDRHFHSTDLRGKSFSIGYGYVTVSGNRYCGDGAGSDGTHTLEVKSQSQVSMEGVLVSILYCEGGWSKLGEHRFITTSDPPHFNIPFESTDTVYELIKKALEEVGFSLNALGDEDDVIINSYKPTFTANPMEFESPLRIIHRLICMTKCYLREVENKTFEIVFPEAADSADETYYSDESPYFKEYVDKQNLLIPNSVVVFCNQDPYEPYGWDTEAYRLITGTASDTDAIATYEEVIRYYQAPFIRSPIDADNRAAAILQRLKAETLSGKILLPFHDCRVELYDKVDVYDRRGE